MRRKIKRTWREAAGFTLVELVVVIAILGILAGGGSVAYSGYVKNAAKKADMTNVANIVRAVDTAGKSMAFVAEGDQVSADGLQVPVGFIVLSDAEITDASGNNQGYVYEMLPTPAEGETAANEGLLQNILTAAFGKDYDAALQLQSNTWTGTNVPALYADANNLYTDVKTLSNVVYDAQGLLSAAGKPLKNQYTSGAEIVAYAAECVTKMSEEEFIQQWISAEGKSTQHAFGLNTYGFEVYTAARKAYNEAVATYIETKAPGNHTTTTYKFEQGFGIGSLSAYRKCTEQKDVQESATTHANAIRNYSESISVGDLVASDTIQSSRYGKGTGCDSYGYEQKSGYYTKKSGYLDDGAQLCATCKAKIAEYPNSPEAKEDARAFYKTMVTMAASSEEALKNTENPWAYYDNYVSKFSSLYSNLETVVNTQNAAGHSAIAITVLSDPETKILSCQVSPDGVVE